MTNSRSSWGHWPVEDLAAEKFASTFYGELLKGKTIADSLVSSRKSVLDLKSVDWADYIHYGSPSFQLKLPQDG